LKGNYSWKKGGGSEETGKRKKTLVISLYLIAKGRKKAQAGEV